MKRNKLWYMNEKQQLYPLLPSVSIFHHFEQISDESKRLTGSSIAQLNTSSHHHIIMQEHKAGISHIEPIYSLPNINIYDDHLLVRRLKQFGLHTYKRLPDERLFLLRMVYLKAWVWSRVSKHYNVMGKSYTVERNSSDLIIHNDEILSEIILRQAETIAGRALYAVGLDIGSVLLAISGTGTIAVRKLFTIKDESAEEDEHAIEKAMRLWQFNRAKPPQPITTFSINSVNYMIPGNKQSLSSKPLILNQKVYRQQEAKKKEPYQTLEQDAINQIERNTVPFLHEMQPELWLGADPELIFVNHDNQIVAAVDILKDDPEGRYGFDSVISEQRVIFPVAEIRPEPQQSPEALYNEIESILYGMWRYGVDAQYEWLAGSMPRELIALGGHLHFSGVKLTPALLRLMDYSLALTFSLIEDKSTADIRKKKYGALGDFRRQEHGGFEYRTLPSWLVSPMLTKAALALSYIIVKDRDILLREWYVSSSIIDDYMEQNLDAVREHSIRLFEIIEALPSYNERKDWIIPLKYMIKVGKRWDETDDIRKHWQVLSSL